MKVAVSILTIDYTNVEKNLVPMLNNMDYLHLDVMDGEFVPNISFGPAFIKSLRKLSDIPFDTHLMIKHPQNYIKQFAEAGSDYITFHVEADCDVLETIDLIHSYGVKAGISIKPNTSVEDIKKYLPLVDMVLVMTVEPGFGGQKFKTDCALKTKELSILKKENGYNYLINVDGGINDVTGKEVAQYVDLAVSGSYVVNSDNPSERINNLKNI